MTKTRVAFLGSRPLGAFVLRLLRDMEDVEVVACICRPPQANAWWSEDPFDEYQGPRYHSMISLRYRLILASQ